MKEITVNVSSFVDIRTKGDYIYVDKTRYVYNLVKSRLNNYVNFPKIVQLKYY